MANAFLLLLAPARQAGQTLGITSICSAHPMVIGAALAFWRDQSGPVLIEATCNQVNQEGGYTGMTPADFSAFVHQIAADEGFDPARLVLGGDHLGPNPWTHLPATQAMEKAKMMVAGFVQAGFSKVHVDASMSCAGDPVPLPDAEIARRNAALAAVAEMQAGASPVYVIGTEVPIPGGAMEEVLYLSVTTPAAAAATVALHRAAFASQGIADAFARVVGVVVQPGVEFGNENVVGYVPAMAQDLSESLERLPMLFEAHSTDYQTPGALAALVRDGFGILKVGPSLTFTLREALYGLDHIADVLFPDRGIGLRAVMEDVMLANPKYWLKYYPGDAAHQKLLRHYSYSDRIRYYWADPLATRAVDTLLALFGDTAIPQPLIAQYLGATYADVMAGQVAPSAQGLLRAAVMRVLRHYHTACAPYDTA